MRRLLIILVRLHWLSHIQLIFLDITESKKYKFKNKQKTKILKCEKLREFIKNELNNKQSLKAIAGKSKIIYILFLSKFDQLYLVFIFHPTMII